MLLEDHQVALCDYPRATAAEVLFNPGEARAGARHVAQYLLQAAGQGLCVAIGKGKAVVPDRLGQSAALRYERQASACQPFERDNPERLFIVRGRDHDLMPRKFGSERRALHATHKPDLFGHACHFRLPCQLFALRPGADNGQAGPEAAFREPPQGVDQGVAALLRHKPAQKNQIAIPVLAGRFGMKDGIVIGVEDDVFRAGSGRRIGAVGDARRRAGEPDLKPVEQAFCAIITLIDIVMLIERLAWREGPYPGGLERDVGLDVDITPGEQSAHLAGPWLAANGERHLGHAGRFGRQRHLVAQGNELFTQGLDDRFDPADLGREDGSVEEDIFI